MSEYKIAFSDNAFGAVVVFSLALMFSMMAYCNSVQSRANGERDKARAVAGICTDGWGRQHKCQ